MSERADSKKQHIIKAAREVFALKGFKDVTMKDIVEKAQISRGGLYLYYDSTESVFKDVLAMEGELEEENDNDGLVTSISDASAGDILMWFLREQNLTPEQLSPMSEELSFLYDYERVRVMRRPHLAQTMQSLKDMGIRMGVISNIISRSVVPHFLAEYGIDGFMDCVITSCGTGIRKPDPEIFRIAERKMGLAPEELAYVGDTISRDVRGTRAAGWRLMIQIRNPGVAHRDKGLENGPWKPDYLIDDLAEIPDIIARENGGA